MLGFVKLVPTLALLYMIRYDIYDAGLKLIVTVIMSPNLVPYYVKVLPITDFLVIRSIQKKIQKH